VLPAGFTQLGLEVHPSPATHQARHVFGRAATGDGQQALFRLRRRDAGQLADLGVRQPAVGQGLGEARQETEGARHTDVLAGGPRGEPDAPGEPGGARGKAVVPAALGVELSDEIEEMGDGGIEVGRQLGDLITQPLEVGRGHLHGESPFTGATLHRGFRKAWRRPGRSMECRPDFPDQSRHVAAGWARTASTAIVCRRPRACSRRVRPSLSSVEDFRQW
jgi:hypothetical protein